VTYGPRTLTRPSSLSSDPDEPANLATYLLARYKAPTLRFQELVIDPFDVDARWTQILSRSIADRVTVKRRPPGGGSVLSQDVHLEAVTHQVDPPRSWTVRYALVPASTVTYWIVGDATFGVLDSTTRLGP
jgi:hypothetical protein